MRCASELLYNPPPSQGGAGGGSRPINTTVGCHTLTRRARCERTAILCHCAVKVWHLKESRFTFRHSRAGGNPRGLYFAPIWIPACAVMTVSGRTSNHSARSSRAFTLLEVLAALLLVAVVLPVLMGAINTATHLGGLASDRARAAILAENRLNEIILDQSWQFGDAADEFMTDTDGPDAERYLWDLHVEQWIDPSVRKLTMTVYWERRGRPQSITLTTAVHNGGDA